MTNETDDIIAKLKAERDARHKAAEAEKQQNRGAPKSSNAGATKAGAASRAPQPIFRSTDRNPDRRP